jgi:hypothetical protein
MRTIQKLGLTMGNKFKAEISIKKKPIVTEVEYCTNCYGLDDFAVSKEVKEVSKLYERFHNCESTGNFEGDFCSRLYVALDNSTEVEPVIDEE